MKSLNDYLLEIEDLSRSLPLSRVASYTFPLMSGRDLQISIILNDRVLDDDMTDDVFIQVSTSKGGSRRLQLESAPRRRDDIIRSLYRWENKFKLALSALDSILNDPSPGRMREEGHTPEGPEAGAFN